MSIPVSTGYDTNQREANCSINFAHDADVSVEVAPIPADKKQKTYNGQWVVH